MKAYIDSQRAGNPNLLLLNAGDDFIGTVWDWRYGTDQAAHFLNTLNIDAMTPGNHDFGASSYGLWVFLMRCLLGGCRPPLARARSAPQISSAPSQPTCPLAQQPTCLPNAL